MTLVRLFVFFGGLLAIALFTALIAPYFVDWSVYRADFERESTKILGQKVVVRGDTELRLLPFPSLTFSDLAVGEIENGQPLMTIKRFEMDLEITPFLSGEILVFDMRVEEPSVTVTLLNDGTLDWALSAKQNLAGNTLVLENIVVSNGQIKLVDLQNQRTKRITNINASLSAPELIGPWDIGGEAEFEAQKVRYKFNTGVKNTEGHIRLRSNLSIDDFPLYLETEGSAKIEDNKPSYDGNFTVQKVVEKNVLNTPADLRSLLSVQVKGAFKVSNERLDISQYRMTSGKKSDPYVIEGKAEIDTGQEPEFLIVARGQQIDVKNIASDNAQNTSGNGISGIERLKALAEQIPIPDFPGIVDLQLPAIIAGATTVRDIVLQAEPLDGGWRLNRLEAKLPGRTNIEANGDVLLGANPSFTGDMLIASQQPSGFSTWLIGRVDPNIRQLSVAGFTANVVFNNDVQQFENLKLIIGQSIIKGAAERQSLEGQTPSISMNFDGDEVDLDKLTALVQLANLGQNTNSGKGFLTHNIGAQIQANKLVSGQFSADNVDTVVSWQDGNLTLERFKFENFAGLSGRLNGQITSLDEAPKGNIEYTLNAASSAQAFDLVSKLTNKHPLVERLKFNRTNFANIDVSGNFEIGNDQTPKFIMEGRIDDTNLRLEANGQALIPTLFDTITSPLAINITAQNKQSHKLLSLLGFSVLPFDFEENGDLYLKISRGFGEDFDVTAKFQSGSTLIDLDGFVDLPNVQDQSLAKGIFTLDVVSDDIEPMLLTFGQNLPGIGSGQPMQLNASILVDDERVELNDVVGRIESNKFDGDLNFKRHVSNLDIIGDLSVDTADFDWLYELALGVRFQSFSSNQTSEPWSTANFQPPFEASPRANINLKLSNLNLPDLDAVSNITTKLTTEPGNLALSDFSGTWLGGTANGDFSISNPNGNAFVSLRGQIEAADISRITWAQEERPILTGKLGIAGNLEGTGASLTEVMSSFNGGGLYNIDGLNISHFQPDIFDQTLQITDTDDFELLPEVVGDFMTGESLKGSYSIKQLAIPYTVTGGVQRISSIRVMDERFKLTGEGRFDLPNKTLSASIDVLYDAGLETQSGATPEISLDYQGQLTAPSRTTNANAMTNFLSIRAYEQERRRVELLQASILEKQHLRREIALVKDQQLRREEQARLKAEEEARIKAELEAQAKADEEARIAAEVEAERIANEAIERAREQQRLDAIEESQPEPKNLTQDIEDFLNTRPTQTPIIQ
jgi:uncharacterized protein involved in outer membrane biogenesis